jgi:hypothetical protein
MRADHQLVGHCEVGVSRQWWLPVICYLGFSTHLALCSSIRRECTRPHADPTRLNKSALAAAGKTVASVYHPDCVTEAAASQKLATVQQWSRESKSDFILGNYMFVAYVLTSHVSPLLNPDHVIE